MPGWMQPRWSTGSKCHDEQISTPHGIPQNTRRETNLFVKIITAYSAGFWDFVGQNVF